MATNVPAEIAARIDPERIQALTLALVRIPSPPGQEKEASEFYARYLQAIGLTVELDAEYPYATDCWNGISFLGNG
jgi:hypothetical protein